LKIINKKAKFDYQIFDRLEAGIVLTGAEVKSIKNSHISLKESFVKIINKELFLINANISPYKFADNSKYDPKKTRKLLAKKKEILSLEKKMESKNLTLIPISIYTKNNKIKLEIALAKGKKQFEKRESKKRQDQNREQEKALKNFN
jgi:SsrA-binding protein